MRLRYGVNFDCGFHANLLPSSLMKGFGKSVNIWRSRQQYSVPVFWLTG